MMRIFWTITISVFAVAGCRQKPGKDPAPTSISAVVSQMTDLMVKDITNPPLASRFFAYAALAGYEVVSQNNSVYKSFSGVLNDYPQLKKEDSITGYNYRLAALLAMVETAKKMQPSGTLLGNYEQSLIDSFSNTMDEEVVANSMRYAQAVSKKILAYAKGDGYNKISNLQRYTPMVGDGNWQPTPPAFISAIEPHFNTVRPFTLQGAAQFKPMDPVAFSKEKLSGFFKMMMQNVTDTLTDEKRAIAAFWDCNPFAVQDNGHLLIGLKKISPGAHWMGITGIACGNAKKDFDETMYVHALVAVGLMDAFICCWDEKFRSNRIRPETAIRRYIDASWQPLIQTPPFPEYLSGHSVISAASATILTSFFGPAYTYTDTVEVRYGLPSRTFTSFKAAAKEAGLSRFYGGIHFMDAVEQGLVQGEQVGNWVLQKAKANTTN